MRSHGLDGCAFDALSIQALRLEGEDWLIIPHSLGEAMQEQSSASSTMYTEKRGPRSRWVNFNDRVKIEVSLLLAKPVGKLLNGRRFKQCRQGNIFAKFSRDLHEQSGSQN